MQNADDTIFYPGVFVSCDRQDLQPAVIFRAPTLNIDVLSPSTQAFNSDIPTNQYIIFAPNSAELPALHLVTGHSGTGLIFKAVITIT